MIGRRALLASAALAPLAGRRHRVGWESNNIFQVLIITGTTGSGVFVYTPSPGAGNLVASVAAAAGVDPYGNNYVAGIADYRGGFNVAASLSNGVLTLWHGSLAAGWTSGSTFSDDGSGGVTLFLLGHPLSVQNGLLLANQAAQVIGGLTTDTEAISSGQAAGLLQTVTNTTGGATGALVRWVVNAAGDVWLGARVSGDTVNRIALTTTAAGLAQISFGAGGSTAPDTFINRNAAGLFASSPIAFYNAGAAETDQVPTFANSWATTAGRAATTYRRIAIKDTMEWVGSVTVPAGFAANQNMTTANPAAYQPVNNQSIVAIDTTNDNIVRLTYLSTGILQFSGPAASTAAAHVLDIPCQQIRLTD